MPHGVVTLDEFEGKKLLARYGVPVIEEALASTPNEAQAAARRLGYPVALKVCSDAILHKTDRGGVILGITSPAELKAAAGRIEKLFRCEKHSLLVQKMAPRGVELIIGAKRDPVFGPVVVAGLGGIFTEVLKDAVTELAPVDRKTAISMFRRLRGAAILSGCRGLDPVDIESAADALVSLSRMAVERSEISEVDINPLIAAPEGAVAVDALIRIGGKASVAPAEPRDPATSDPLFNPGSIALIGASSNPAKGGNIILKNILKAGFKGALYPVNPAGGRILGLDAYPSVREIPGPVDLAMIVIPKAAVNTAVDDCIAKGVKAIILSTGGYSDIGESGEADQKALVKKVAGAGIRMMGPNSIGTIHPKAGLATSIVGLEPIPQGGVSMIGQSGVFSSGWGRWIADSRPFGVSKVACMGNKGEINESDLLEYLAQDPETNTIGMYLEGVISGPRFITAAGAASRRKPVVVIKSGRTEAGAKAIASHTGSLAGSDTVFDAVCARTGMLRVHDPEAFFDTLAAFDSLALPKGNRLGVLSISGMGCVVSTDAAHEYSVKLPDLKPATLKRLREIMPPWAPVRNPVDIWSAVEQNGSMATMRHISQCLIGQDDIDALLIIFVLMPESIFDIAGAFGEIVSQNPGKPVLAAYYGGTEAEIEHVQEGFRNLGVPTYPTPERAIYAFGQMAKYARFIKGLKNNKRKAGPAR